jgi:hypothetical protein
MYHFGFAKWQTRLKETELHVGPTVLHPPIIPVLISNLKIFSLIPKTTHICDVSYINELHLEPSMIQLIISNDAIKVIVWSVKVPIPILNSIWTPIIKYLFQIQHAHHSPSRNGSKMNKNIYFYTPTYNCVEFGNLGPRWDIFYV